MTILSTRTFLSSFLSPLPPLHSSTILPSPPPLPSAVTAAARPRRVTMASRVRIAVVGDVHGDWDLKEDEKALRFLQADVVLFTGDFGDENVDVVKNISKLDMPKAAILGNHDAWFTSQWSQRKSNRVELQLQYLKEQHVGYSRLDFPLLGFTIVGGRPFSCGGDRIFRRGIIQARYGIQNMEESAQKIFEAASGTPEGHYVIFLAHNGPTGLGANTNDICGRDWWFEGGDFGDEDLRQAISNLKGNTSISIPLVVFGHMHKELALGAGLRKMIVVGDDNTVYLNGAIVPRVRLCEQDSNAMNRSSGSSNHKTDTLRAFTMIEIQDKLIERIAETWVAVSSSGSKVVEETVLYERAHSHLQI